MRPRFAGFLSFLVLASSLFAQSRTPLNNPAVQSDINMVGHKLTNLDTSNLPFQPLDPDLTAIAALSTDAFGRGLLPLANPGAVRTYIGAGTGSGTVTSFSAGDLSPLFTTTEATITTTPALTFSLSTASANTFFGNGTGSTAAPTFMSASTARTALALVPGTDVQAFDADLATIAGLTATTDNFLVSVSSAWASRTPGQVRTTLGLVIGTNVEAWDADLDLWAAITPASGIGTFLATPSSANLAAAVTNETGSGSLVFATSPILVTPALGTPSSGDASNLTNLNATQLASGTIPAARMPALTGDVTSSAGSVATTIAAGAVTDAKASLSVKPAVTVVAISNLTLSGEQTIDGVLTSSSLVLATAQSTGSQNGPWVTAAGAWTRPTWYSAGSATQAPQFLTTFVRLGTTYQGSTWRMTTASVTIDTTATTWAQTPISLASSNVTGSLSGSSVSGGTFGAVNGSALTALTAANITASTAVGRNILNLTNPGAIAFPKIAADNSVSAESAATYRTSLGLAIGSDVQAFDSDLNTIAGLTATTDNFLVSVSSSWASRTPAQVRTTLGLVIGTNVEAWDADLDLWAAITPASGIGTFLATPSSANLAAAVTNETGSGALVFATNPTFTTGINTPAVTSTSASYNQPNYFQFVSGDANWSYGIFNSVNDYWMQVTYAEAGNGLRGFRVYDTNAATPVFNSSRGVIKVAADASNYFTMSVAAGGLVTIDAVGSTPSFTFSDKVIHTLPEGLKSYTVAGLPAGTQGDWAYVTDATAPTYNAALTGGGSVKIPVFYNGSAWVSH